jgi:hypothetical protein
MDAGLQFYGLKSQQQTTWGGGMPGIEPEAGRVSKYSLLVACPQCGARMILHVGLAGDPKNDRLECIECHSEIELFVPGQIVGGPFPATN